ncbi:MAG: cyclic nucleotide-binding domain-containing protein [Acidimicrobiales bacterium]
MRLVQLGSLAGSVFEGLDPAERETIAAVADELVVPASTTIFDIGDPADTLYVVVEGRVELQRDGRSVAEVGAGDFFGEMALFNRYARVAAAVAAEDCRLIAISQERLQPLVLRQDAAAVKLEHRLGTLAVERIARLDQQVAERLSGADPELAAAFNQYLELKHQLVAGWALAYHAIGKPGKLGIASTKPAATAADLSVAYSPGVAEPCVAIRDRPDTAYDYTAKGHLVGVITNGTAVLGLGAIGAAAAKPVMEGKAVLFKRFADIDAYDVEIDESDPARFVDAVCAVAPTFGGINLEDVAAPDCFAIEEECRRRLDIPVMHDDQHGTAIIIGAGLLNAVELVGKRIQDIRIVFAGAGAAGFAAARYVLALGVRPEQLVLTDVQGVVYRGRGDGNYLDTLAADTSARTLAEAINGADAFVGVSAAGVLTPDMLRSMAADPIVFALANPVPEIDPQLARRTRTDVIIATGRSDHPNQVNNVLAFPYIFRGALDIRARAITEEMKLAATKAIAVLAREPITADAGFDGTGLAFGRGYLIPKPFDRRLLPRVAAAVAEAGLHAGVGRVGVHLDTYRAELAELAVRL